MEQICEQNYESIRKYIDVICGRNYNALKTPRAIKCDCIVILFITLMLDNTIFICIKNLGMMISQLLKGWLCCEYLSSI